MFVACHFMLVASHFMKKIYLVNIQLGILLQ